MKIGRNCSNYLTWAWESFLFRCAVAYCGCTEQYSEQKERRKEGKKEGRKEGRKEGTKEGILPPNECAL